MTILHIIVTKWCSLSFLYKYLFFCIIVFIIINIHILFEKYFLNKYKRLGIIEYILLIIISLGSLITLGSYIVIMLFVFCENMLYKWADKVLLKESLNRLNKRKDL